MKAPVADAVSAAEELDSETREQLVSGCVKAQAHQLEDVPTSARRLWKRCTHCRTVFYKGDVWFPPDE